ncbi:MAG: carboxypeptidase-like regulatory domain-containing protein, partial [Bacteroidales bacterium]|nr:carboxypeptidase-like regulatory domain-containing protein [Bacteroidales bacterium]
MQSSIGHDSDWPSYNHANFYDLQPETKYWFVAEATDSYGTRRSDTVAFYTYGTFIDDRDSTEYKSIIIGNQTWMAENLRYEGNVPLGQTASSTNPYRYYPEGNVEVLGYLYNWPAAINGENSSKMNPSGVQGICPNGWHLPSDAEWKELNKELGSGLFDDAGAQMAGNEGVLVRSWESGKLNNSYYFGTSGFNALPAGGIYGTSDSSDEEASFWSTTETNLSTPNGMANAVANYGIAYFSTSLDITWALKEVGSSVRCIRGTTVYAAYDTVVICADHYTYLDTTFTESGDYLRRFFYEEFADTAYSLHLNIDDCYRMASGVVTDASTSTAIPNARVVIGNAVAWTNDNGEYSLMAPKGNQTLWVSAVDYATYSEAVFIMQDTALSFELYSAQISIDAEDITITTYPYMVHYDSITISNTGTTPLVWSSVADYEGIELLPESEETRHSRNSRALWDSIQTFTTRFNAEQAVATDGFFIYTSSWQRPGEFNRYTPDGEYVETFFIENVG